MEYLSMKKYTNVGFDLKNSTINYNGKSKKVVEDSNYIFKIQKTQIKAQGGIVGLYEFMRKITIEDFGYCWFAKICENI